MSRLTTTFTDSVTGKPINMPVIDVFTGSDLTGTPVASYQGDANGVIDVEDANFDNPNCTIAIQPFGYYQMVGNPGFFQGVTVPLNPVSSVITAIPVWAWMLLIAVAAYFGYKYFKKK